MGTEIIVNTTEMLTNLAAAKLIDLINQTIEEFTVVSSCSFITCGR